MPDPIRLIFTAEARAALARINEVTAAIRAQAGETRAASAVAKAAAAETVAAGRAVIEAQAQKLEGLRAEMKLQRDVTASYKRGSEERILSTRREIEIQTQLEAALGRTASAARVSGAAGAAGAAAGGVRGRVRGRLAGGVSGVLGVGPGVVAGIAGAVGLAKSVGIARDFASEMELIHTQAGAAASEVARMTAATLKLSPQVATGPMELAKALFHVESAGFRGAKAEEALRIAAEGAKVGHADLESVTNALVAAMTSGVKGAGNFSKSMGVLNAIVGAGNMRMGDLTAALGTGILTSAETFGVSIQDVGAALATMTIRGQGAAESATRLRMTFALMAAPTSKARAELAKIGLTGDQLAREMRTRGLIPAIQLLRDHLRGSGLDATQQAQVLTRAFGGGRSSGAIMLLVNHVDALRGRLQQIRGTSDRFGEAWKKTQEQSAFQTEKFKANVQVLGVQIGSALLPAVNQVTVAASKWIGRMNEGGKAQRAASSAVKTFVGVVQAVAGPLRAMSGLVGGVGHSLAILAVALVMKRPLEALVRGFAVTMAQVRADIALTEASTRTMGVVWQTTMLKMKVATRAFLAATGFGIILLAFSILVEYILTHWAKVKKMFADFWDWLKRTAIETVLAVVEPFSHLPGRMGKWARDMKDELKAQLNQMEIDAATSGKAIGAAVGKQMLSSFGPFLGGLQSQINSLNPILGSVASTAAGGDKGGMASRIPAGIISPIPKGKQGAIIGTPGVGTHNQSDWQSRNAIDITVAPHTPILAVETGFISKVTVNPPGVTHTASGKNLAGSSVTLVGGFNTYFYTHLESVAVKEGQHVKEGQIIGHSGALNHVHFAVQKGSPMGFVNAPHATVGGKPGSATPEPTPTPTPHTTPHTKPHATPTGGLRNLTVPAGLSPAQRKVAELIYKTALAQGASPEVALAMVAGAYLESRLDPRAGGGGLLQITSGDPKAQAHYFALIRAGYDPAVAAVIAMLPEYKIAGRTHAGEGSIAIAQAAERPRHPYASTQNARDIAIARGFRIGGVSSRGPVHEAASAAVKQLRKDITDALSGKEPDALPAKLDEAGRAARAALLKLQKTLADATKLSPEAEARIRENVKRYGETIRRSINSADFAQMHLERAVSHAHDDALRQFEREGAAWHKAFDAETNAHLDGMRKAADAQLREMQREFSATMKAFDRETQRGLDARAAPTQTPTEALLAARDAARQAAADAQALSDAYATGDPAQIAQAEYEAETRRLEAKAKAERDAADEAAATAQNTYRDQRDAQAQALQEQENDREAAYSAQAAAAEAAYQEQRQALSDAEDERRRIQLQAYEDMYDDWTWLLSRKIGAWNKFAAWIASHPIGAGPTPGGRDVPDWNDAPGAKPGDWNARGSRGIFGQALGGDYLVSRPTLFLAGEAGPERATFTPIGGRGRGGGDTYVSFQFNGHVTDQADLMETIRSEMLALGRRQGGGPGSIFGGRA